MEKEDGHRGGERDRGEGERGRDMKEVWVQGLKRVTHSCFVASTTTFHDCYSCWVCKKKKGRGRGLI